MWQSAAELSGRYWPQFLVLFVFCLRLFTEALGSRLPNLPAAPDRPLIVEVIASADQRQRVQLYFLPDGAKAGEYTEANSVLLEVDAGEPRPYWFPLPSPNVRGLRLKSPEPVHLHSARVVDGTSRETRLALPLSKSPTGGIHQLTPPDSPILPAGLALPPGGVRWTISIALALSLSLLLVAAGARWLGRWDPGRFYLTAIVAFFVIASACRWNGSSSDYLAYTGLPEGSVQPLLGHGKAIRSDEFNQHTPTILYQLNRRDPLALESISGPGPAVLFTDAPARHWSMLFRPQLWGFFVLPRDYAFAVYWQWKMLLLLGGTFAAFRLLAGSAKLAIFGSLWYFISAYTQWAYSWPSMLPEAIGLACLAFVAVVELLEAADACRAILAGVAFVVLSIDFALCTYPPFQIPLVYAAVGMFAAWIVARGRAPEWLEARRVAFALAGIAVILGLFYLEVRQVLAIIAQTVYPGKRSFAGGLVPWTVLASGFVDLLKAEDRVPQEFLNICEGSGYLWFGPLTLLFRRPGKSAAVLLGCFGLLLAWMVLPIPAAVGKPLFLDMVQGTRVTPALGLVNIALALLFLRDSRSGGRWSLTVVAGCVTGLSILLAVMNTRLGGFFALSGVLACAALGGLALAALANGSRRVFAVLVLTPLIWANLLINPLNRGLPVYEQSSLARYVREHPPEPGRWLIFSDDLAVPQYFGALGLEVLNFFQYVPYLEDWRLFDPDRKLDGFYNGSGYTVAAALPAGSPARMEAAGAFAVPPLARKFLVDPGDPRLRQIRVRYFAHQGPPPEGAFPAEKFEQLTAEPLQGFTIYRAK